METEKGNNDKEETVEFGGLVWNAADGSTRTEYTSIQPGCGEALVSQYPAESSSAGSWYWRAQVGGLIDPVCRMAKSKIEWTDETWNPVTGCTKVSQGCKHCYAERTWERLSANPKTVYFGREFTDVQCHPERLDQPLRWKSWRTPRRVFVNSMSDLFHEDVPDEFIRAVFAVMAAAASHTFQMLTKRPVRMQYLLSKWESDGLVLRSGFGVRLPNVWLGVSVEDQATADYRIPLLMQTPAAVRWISAEPLLGPVDLRRIEHPNYSIHADALGGVDSRAPCDSGLLDWVVVGGESGPKARPMHPDWVRSLRDQCEATGVPFLFKQWGEFLPDGQVDNNGDEWVPVGTRQRSVANNGGFNRIGKKHSGRLLDGVLHDGFPS